MIRRLAPSLLALASGCATLRVELRALPDVNDGQPVALHLHPLRRLPTGLPALGCAEVHAGETPWSAHLAGPASVITALPARRSLVAAERPPAARWLLVVPEWSRCAGADGWALIRLLPATRRVRLELTARRLVLPWDTAAPLDGGRRLRQRGYVDGRPVRVVAPAPRAVR